MLSNEYKERYSSQIPALHLLMTLGYEYLPPSAALALRGWRRGMPVLTDVLAEQLDKLNSITFRDQPHTFSEKNINRAVFELAQLPFDSLISTSEQAYDLLTLGKSLEQTIDGYTKSFSLQYIDWAHPANNVFQVCDEFEVERRNSKLTRRPDVVLFVNGIPLAIIECKRPDLENALQKGISQHLRNQKLDNIPEFYIYSQLLLSVCQNGAMYGTTGTELDFWSTWREEDEQAQEEELTALINRPLTESALRKLCSERDPKTQQGISQLLTSGERLATPQDRAIHSLLRPERLLELTFRYLIYDNKVKKIARYQQYFAVKETVKRVTKARGDGPRRGGVIWHTTGSGKSLTMVMLAKALALDSSIANPKVVLVTDRVDLDVQISNTFKSCGMIPARARTGSHLIDLISRDQANVITTVIDKFETVAHKRVRDEDRNIFVLVDESHRSVYGTTDAMMRKVFPNACYIGFTGTPLLKSEKSTAAKFGGFIHSYSMNRAVRDGAVRPLLYEGRMSDLAGDNEDLDRWFERITEGLTDKQKADLKRKFRREEELLKADSRIAEVAYDINRHFVDNFKGTGKKGQLAVSSKEMAVRYLRYFQDFGEVSVAVVMSPPDTRENHSNLDESRIPEVQAFWKDMMARYGSEKQYLDSIVSAFKFSDEPELLIVIDKLLTGFDAPRNSILYLDKRLKDHNILQAIARVNRVYEGKDYGLVIDYRGIFGALTEAVDTYAALEREGFDRSDIEGTITDVSQEIALLSQRHSNVWEIFKDVANTSDLEAMQLALEPEDVRHRFFQALNLYAGTLQLALGNAKFVTETPARKVSRFKADFKMFLNLRQAVRQRFGESVDYSVYERQIRNLVNKHIGASTVRAMGDPIDIFAMETLEKQLELLDGEAAKADAIASRVKKSLTARLEEDPVFFKNLSDIIDEAIRAHREKRFSDVQYLQRMLKVLEEFHSGGGQTLPKELKTHQDAAAYFGILTEQLAGCIKDKDLLASAALSIEEALDDRKIRDWTINVDITNDMANAVEDVLFAMGSELHTEIPYNLIDATVEQIITVAKRRDLR